MRGWLRLVQLLSMTVWVGGLVFFAFVLAPTAFQVLPVHDAGLVVGAALRVFDVVGMSWGILFLVATFTIVRQMPRGFCRFCYVQFVAALAMLLATFVIHFGILPSMEEDRRNAGGDIASVPEDTPARVHFNRLHALSEGVDGVVLVLGLGVIFLLSREMVPHTVPPPAAD